MWETRGRLDARLITKKEKEEKNVSLLTQQQRGGTTRDNNNNNQVWTIKAQLLNKMNAKALMDNECSCFDAYLSCFPTLGKRIIISHKFYVEAGLLRLALAIFAYNTIVVCCYYVLHTKANILCCSHRSPAHREWENHLVYNAPCLLQQYTHTLVFVKLAALAQPRIANGFRMHTLNGKNSWNTRIRLQIFNFTRDKQTPNNPFNRKSINCRSNCYTFFAIENKHWQLMFTKHGVALEWP